LQNGFFFLTGFGLFAFVSYTLLSTHLASLWVDWKQWLLLGICAIIGLVGGSLFMCILKIGIFIIGASLGVTVASISLLTPLMDVLNKGENGSLWVFIYIGGIALVFGILALFFKKPLLVIGTSFYGSYLIFTAVDRMWLNTNFSKILPDIISHFKLPKIDSDWKCYLLLGGVIVFSVAGIIIQYKKTGVDEKTGVDPKYTKVPRGGHGMTNVVNYR